MMPATNTSLHSYKTNYYSINCNRRLLDFSNPVLMGILNVGPDSFFDGGKFTEESSMRLQIRKMLSEGAQIVDVGAASSRPGADEITVEEELKRLLPAISLLVSEFPEAVISVDTYHSRVAEEVIKKGGHIINDVSGGDFDAQMFLTIAELKVPYILMHMQGKPKTMQQNPQYENVTIEVLQSLIKKIKALREKGVKDIIVDPGFGFGKTVDHNFELLANLQHFQQLECPVLAGISRKSMITKALGIKSAEALNGTSILNTIALQKGANILRVHDVKEAKQAIDLYKLLQKNS